MTRHIVLPDVQAKPGNDFTFLNRIGQYIVDKQPDVIVCIGDFADMPSLSSYDVGKRQFEGRRYVDDIKAAHDAMFQLLLPMNIYNRQQVKNKKKTYNPRMVLTLGNHENRIQRAIDNDPKIEGVISVQDLEYEKLGWEVYPFLDVVVIDGIAYSHYFTSGVMGRPVSSASALLSKKHMSSVMGHVQHRQIAYANTADGRQLTGLFAGSAYEHDEDYLGAQGNAYWRGIWVLNEVDNGSFDEMPVSLDYLEKKYG